MSNVLKQRTSNRNYIRFTRAIIPWEPAKVCYGTVMLWTNWLVGSVLRFQASILNPCVGTSQEHIRGNHNHVTTTQVEKTQLWCFSSVTKKRSAIIHQPLSRWNTIPEPCVWFFDEPVHQQLPTVQAEHYRTCAPKSKFKVIQRNIYLHMQAKWSHCRALVHAHTHVCARICVHTAGVWYINWGWGWRGGQAKHIDPESSTINGVNIYVIKHFFAYRRLPWQKNTTTTPCFVFALQVWPGMDRLMPTPAATDSNRVL